MSLSDREPPWRFKVCALQTLEGAEHYPTKIRVQGSIGG